MCAGPLSPAPDPYHAPVSHPTRCGHSAPSLKSIPLCTETEATQEMITQPALRMTNEFTFLSLSCALLFNSQQSA